MTMKFYMTPGSCSTAIHILLEEVEAIFEVHLVDLMAGDNKTPEYLQLNPKGTIPVLITDDNLVLTDVQSMAWWIARQNPKKALLPTDIAAECRTLEWMSYAVNTIHGQGFTRIFTPDRYSLPGLDNGAGYDAIKQQGEEIVANAFALLEPVLAGRELLFDRFSIADAALFYVMFWADRINQPLPESCKHYYQTLLTRPTVRQVLSEEGYGAMFR
ncbi:glutathione S-transferase family protein [Amphritea sp.]|uniref:glutathione S-transferase family protein n=1 Tax=Amphritea sp. TaxID=1872502 RepID=UPI003D1281FF